MSRTDAPARGPIAAATAALALTLLTGCSGAATPAPTSTDAADSPLGRYLVAASGGDQSDAALAAEHVKVENVIAACMADQGFDYTPTAWDTLGGSNPGDWRPDDRDWVAQWGYGVIAFPAMQQVIADNADGDENTAYYESLSASEQAAYSDALYGPQLTQDQIAANLAGASGRVTWEQQGCWGRGYHEVRGDDPLQDDPQFQPLLQAIVAFQQSEFTAPDFDALNAEWSSCMADAGHPGFTRQQDAQQSISDAQSTLAASQSTPVDMGDPIFDDLGRQEVGLALADLDCRDTTDYRARALVIRDAVENRFVADHRTELDELVAAAEQGR